MMLRERTRKELDKDYVDELYELLPENVVRQYSNILKDKNNIIPLESDDELTMEDINNNICCMLASEINYTLLSISYQYNYLHPNEKEVYFLNLKCRILKRLLILYLMF